MSHYEDERNRLNQRIANIEDKELLRALRRYRSQINKKSAIMERGTYARPYATSKGLRYVARDEIQLCHRFLDEQKVALNA